MVNIRLLVSESDQSIAAKIHKAIAWDIDGFMQKKITSALAKIRIIASKALFASPEIASLSGGVLKADFGLTSDPSHDIVSAVVASLDLRIKKTKYSSNSMSGGFTLTLQPSDYLNLLSLPAANQAIEGGSIPWLEWMLTLGDSIIIANFGVRYGQFGRTGEAYMSRRYGPFKVNSAFSGNSDNNFITRALSGVRDELNNAIKEVLL